MFTIARRDALRDRILQLAATDARVVGGAVVGSLAPNGGGDRFSDLDLTFAVADTVPPTDVLEDWTRALSSEFAAIHLVDLARGPTTYRVFLFPDTLQCDLSVTPAAQFRPAGPRFRLLFGQTAAAPPTSAAASPAPTVAGELFGWGVIYALHARACIGRGRVWQAEHAVGAVRDHTLSLACLRHRLPAAQGRGYDDLPAELLARFGATHVRSLAPETLRDALAVTLRELLREGAEARLPHVEVVAHRLTNLADAS
jgi:hypothetical protein